MENLIDFHSHFGEDISVVYGIILEINDYLEIILFSNYTIQNNQMHSKARA